jgi:hypothetical protein
MTTVATRLGHTNGRVYLAYDNCGQKIVTIGDDGEMRVWAGMDDDKCVSHLIGGKGLAVCASDDKIFVGVFNCSKLKLKLSHPDQHHSWGWSIARQNYKFFKSLKL